MAEEDAAAFLDRHTASASQIVHWPGNLSFQVRTFLTSETPPAGLLSSARAIVLRGDEVLVVTDRTPSTHITPGGRIEPGEEPREAVVREAGEETGWEVAPLRQIGVLHLRHLQPRSDGYPYAYPDFFQAVFVAKAVRFRPELREPEGWETEARFIPARDAINLALGAGERVLLAAALEALQERSDRS